ncbi:unnamed protein product [Caenorhabditis brenneri]
MANRDFRLKNFEKVTMNFNEKPVLTSVESPKKLVVYWEKEIDGLIFMLDYLTELFPYMSICYLGDQGYSQEDNKTVIECGTKSQNEDICDLVNKIMNGGLPAFKVSRTLVVSPNMDEIANGMNYEKIPSQLQCKLKHTKYGGSWLDVYGVYDYEGADGKVVAGRSGIGKYVIFIVFFCTKKNILTMKLVHY